jgi:hypothetical protein
MAKKKSKLKREWVKATKKSSPRKSPAPVLHGLADFAEVQRVLGSLSDEEREGFLSMVEGMLTTESFAGPSLAGFQKRRQSAVERLVEKARSVASPREAVPILRQAVERASTALGKRLAKNRGHIGNTQAGLDLLEAKGDLSRALRIMGDRAGSLVEAQETFELDPSDPCEVRSVLLAGYLEADRLDDARQLLDEHCEEPWAAWEFGQLLVMLRLGERGTSADDQLRQAHAINSFVVSILLGERQVPLSPMVSYETGDDNEAQTVAYDFLPCWKETPGAISWLREATARLDLDIFPSDEEPVPIDPRELADLPPHEHPTWVVGTHALANLPGTSGNAGQEQWVLFAFTPEGSEIQFDIAEERPTAAELCDFLGDTMLAADPPSKPDRCLVHPPQLVRGMKRFAKQAGIDVAPSQESAEFFALFDQMSERLRGGTALASSIPAGAIGQLPLDPDEVWEAAIVHLSQRITIGARSIRPWFVLVMTRDGAVLWHELLVEFPPQGTLAAAVRMAMMRPLLGPPRRPRQILVRELGDAVALRDAADEAGCLCDVAPHLPAVDHAQETLTRELLGGEHPAAQSRIPGLTPAGREQFYTAAADFFKASPWRAFDQDSVVAFTAHDAAGQPAGERYGLVMGQSGLVLGLAIYEQWSDLERAFEADSPEANAQAANGFSVMFGEESDVPPVDLDAIEQFGWPIATPEAYPTALRIRPKMQIDAPSAEEMEFLAQALSGVAQLAQSGDRETTIDGSHGSLRVWRKGLVTDRLRP